MRRALGYKLDAPHEALFHFDELGQSLCQLRGKCACGVFAEGQAEMTGEEP